MDEMIDTIDMSIDYTEHANRAYAELMSQMLYWEWEMERSLNEINALKRILRDEF